MGTSTVGRYILLGPEHTLLLLRSMLLSKFGIIPFRFVFYTQHPRYTLRVRARVMRYAGKRCGSRKHASLRVGPGCIFILLHSRCLPKVKISANNVRYCHRRDPHFESGVSVRSLSMYDESVSVLYPQPRSAKRQVRKACTAKLYTEPPTIGWRVATHTMHTRCIVHIHSQ